MCGILAIFGSSLPDLELRKKLIECSQRLRHRGPDWSGYLVEPGTGIGHERLAIIDPESGAQPLYSADKKIVVAANGEVYNYKDLYASLAVPYAPLTGSDCEVVIPLYQAHGIDFPKYLRGMFSLVVYDRTDGSFYATRDHVGKTPMYMGYVRPRPPLRCFCTPFPAVASPHNTSFVQVRRGRLCVVRVGAQVAGQRLRPLRDLPPRPHLLVQDGAGTIHPRPTALLLHVLLAPSHPPPAHRRLTVLS